MAGDWIKMRVDLYDAPEVIAMAETLAVDEDLVVGKLHRIWAWADRHTTDGNAAGVSGAWVDRYLRLDGFAQAMADVGWLHVYQSGIAFPNFDRHNGKTAKTRALTAKRVSDHKDRGGARGKANAASVSTALPREEKRRDPSPSSPPPEPEGWGKVEGELKRLGMAAWREAMSLARENRLSAEYLLELIGHYRARADDFESVGVLYTRIERAFPEQSVSEGWPEPSESKQRKRSEHARKEREHYLPQIKALKADGLGELVEAIGDETMAAEWARSRADPDPELFIVRWQQRLIDGFKRVATGVG